MSNSSLNDSYRSKGSVINSASLQMSLHRDSSCEIVSSTEKPDDILISQQVEKSVIRKLVIIIVLCAIFMALELVGGFFANSLAIICDGFHLLSDLGGFVISLISTYLSSRKATRKMNFGFRRIEILGAFSSVIFIWILTGSLLYMAVNRIILADYEIDSKIMIVMATIGVLVNGIMACVLSCNHKHHHVSMDESKSLRGSVFIPPRIIDSKSSFGSRRGDDKFTEPEVKPPKKHQEADEKCEHVNMLISRNINIRAAFIHIIGDMIQSIGVLLASIIIFNKPDLKIADPLCTIVFSVIVLCTTLPILIDIVNVLSESFPKNLDYELVRSALSNVHGVRDVHYLKVWCLSVDSFALNAHISVERTSMSLDSVAKIHKACQEALLKISHFDHINLQVDFTDLVGGDCLKYPSGSLVIQNGDHF